jgi:hypothetical protein
MSANSGQGAVIQKNIQLENFKAVDCLTAIKHGNGRDWWVIFRKSDFPSGGNNAWYMYLVTPQGITNQPIQSIGSFNSTNLGQISFNASGNRMAYINYKGLIELYDFSRCTGIISSPVTISPESTQAPWPGYGVQNIRPPEKRSLCNKNTCSSYRLLKIISVRFVSAKYFNKQIDIMVCTLVNYY